MDDPKSTIVDASGKPIPNRLAPSNRWGAISKRFRTVFVTISVIVAGVAAFVGNIEKIKKLFTSGSASSPGLEITDVIAAANPSGESWTLDFRLLNSSKTSVSLSRIRLATEKYEYFRSGNLSALEVSDTYEVDLGPLEKDGAKIEHSISHVLQPLEADRFKVILGTTDTFGGDERRVWHLKPTLVTSAGEKEWNAIKIVLPAPK